MGNNKSKIILSSDRSRKFAIYSTSTGAPFCILSFCLFIKMPSPVLAIYALLGALLYLKQHEVIYTLRESGEYRKESAKVLAASVAIIMIYTPIAVVFLPLLSVYLTKKMIKFYNELIVIEEFNFSSINTKEDVTEEEKKGDYNAS